MLRTFHLTCLNIFNLKYYELWEMLMFEVLIETWAVGLVMLYRSKEEKKIVGTDTYI